jgi:hypothetical protein
MSNEKSISQEHYLIALQQKVNELMSENLLKSAYISKLESELKTKGEDDNGSQTNE